MNVGPFFCTPPPVAGHKQSPPSFSFNLDFSKKKRKKNAQLKSGDPRQAAAAGAELASPHRPLEAQHFGLTLLTHVADCRWDEFDDAGRAALGELAFSLLYPAAGAAGPARPWAARSKAALLMALVAKRRGAAGWPSLAPRLLQAAAGGEAAAAVAPSSLPSPSEAAQAAESTATVLRFVAEDVAAGGSSENDLLLNAGERRALLAALASTLPAALCFLRSSLERHSPPASAAARAAGDQASASAADAARRAALAAALAFAEWAPLGELDAASGLVSAAGSLLTCADDDARLGAADFLRVVVGRKQAQEEPGPYARALSTAGSALASALAALGAGGAAAAAALDADGDLDEFGRRLADAAAAFGAGGHVAKLPLEARAPFVQAMLSLSSHPYVLLSSRAMAMWPPLLASLCGGGSGAGTAAAGNGPQHHTAILPPAEVAGPLLALAGDGLAAGSPATAPGASDEASASSAADGGNGPVVEVPHYFDSFADYRAFLLDHRALLMRIVRAAAGLLPEVALAQAAGRAAAALSAAGVSFSDGGVLASAAAAALASSSPTPPASQPPPRNQHEADAALDAAVLFCDAVVASVCGGAAGTGGGGNWQQGAQQEQQQQQGSHQGGRSARQPSPTAPPCSPHHHPPPPPSPAALAALEALLRLFLAATPAGAHALSAVSRGLEALVPFAALPAASPHASAGGCAAAPSAAAAPPSLDVPAAIAAKVLDLLDSPELGLAGDGRAPPPASPPAGWRDAAAARGRAAGVLLSLAKAASGRGQLAPHLQALGGRLQASWDAGRLWPGERAVAADALLAAAAGGERAAAAAAAATQHQLQQQQQQPAAPSPILTGVLDWALTPTRAAWQGDAALRASLESPEAFVARHMPLSPCPPASTGGRGAEAGPSAAGAPVAVGGGDARWSLYHQAHALERVARRCAPQPAPAGSTPQAVARAASRAAADPLWAAFCDRGALSWALEPALRATWCLHAVWEQPGAREALRPAAGAFELGPKERALYLKRTLRAPAAASSTNLAAGEGAATDTLAGTGVASLRAWLRQMREALYQVLGTLAAVPSGLYERAPPGAAEGWRAALLLGGGGRAFGAGTGLPAPDNASYLPEPQHLRLLERHVLLPLIRGCPPRHRGQWLLPALAPLLQTAARVLEAGWASVLGASGPAASGAAAGLPAAGVKRRSASGGGGGAGAGDDEDDDVIAERLLREFTQEHSLVLKALLDRPVLPTAAAAAAAPPPSAPASAFELGDCVLDSLLREQPQAAVAAFLTASAMLFWPDAEAAARAAAVCRAAVAASARPGGGAAPAPPSPSGSAVSSGGSIGVFAGGSAASAALPLLLAQGQPPSPPPPPGSVEATLRELASTRMLEGALSMLAAPGGAAAGAAGAEALHLARDVLVLELPRAAAGSLAPATLLRALPRLTAERLEGFAGRLASTRSDKEQRAALKRLLQSSGSDAMQAALSDARAASGAVGGGGGGGGGSGAVAAAAASAAAAAAARGGGADGRRGRGPRAPRQDEGQGFIGLAS